MQLLPTTWSYVETVLIGHTVQHDADGNVEVGMAYLRHLLDVFGGNEQLALAGWYQGERVGEGAGAVQGEQDLRRRRARAPAADVSRAGAAARIESRPA